MAAISTSSTGESAPVKGMSYWALMTIFMAFSTGISMIIVPVSVALAQRLGADPGVTVLIFTVIAGPMQYALFRNMANRNIDFSQRFIALVRNQPVREAEISSSDVFAPLYDQLNVLIRERADLKTMRGTLVEQISEAAAQEERKRLARDLHDSIKQQVFSMSVSASAAYAHLEGNPTAARAALLDVKQSAQEAMVEMRALLQQLSPAPLEKSGLVQALREQCEALAYRTGAKVETQFGTLPPDDRLPIGAQETIFRIAQEALSNIARHARAMHVTLALTTEDEAVTLKITDNGQGFDISKAPEGMGLGNIRTRAQAIGATIALESETGKGTMLNVRIPQIQPMPEEPPVNPEVERLSKSVVRDTYIVAGAASVLLLVVSLFAYRLFNRPDFFGEGDPVMVVIFVAMVAAVVVSAPLAVLRWRDAIRGRQQLLALAGPGSFVDLHVRRHALAGGLLFFSVVAWLAPLMLIRDNDPNWAPVVLSVFGIAVGGRLYYLMMRTYQRELLLMPLSRRIEALNNRLKEVRTAWLSVVFVIAVQIFSVLIGGGFNGQLPPAEADHWMQMLQVGIVIFLIGNQVISLVVYRRWMREAVAAEGGML
ncbi:MAG: sensor histidine kinase [Pleurocapsa minor GSE-CHR-MK-17-07R]|nr:sensor histidine kinase [Pleurocapsa minor GSE-CHR-MK 17-07R]